MKFLLLLTLSILINSPLFAYDESLMINVKKVSKLLERAESNGVTPDGSKCYVELRRIEDGYYTLYSELKKEYTFVGLDIEAYGKIISSWTKRSFSLHQGGADGSQNLFMKEEFATKKLLVKSKEEFNGSGKEILCYLPLK